MGTADAKADPKVWHEVRIDHRGTSIAVSFDGKKMIELADSTFSEPGMVGLWTKADAATAFDDLTVYSGMRRSSGRVNFDGDKVGSAPRAWKVAETNGEGKLATWQVIADASAPSPPRAIAITANENYGATFNLLMAQGTSYGDLEVKVMVKAVAGEEDQGGGPIWRAKDADNYYICRWNPLENNFRVYFVKDGRRKQLGTADVKTDAKVWHEVSIVHKGTQITASFDGKKMIKLADSTFSEPGMVGLWVKADGRTAFDDFSRRRILDN